MDQFIKHIKTKYDKDEIYVSVAFLRVLHAAFGQCLLPFFRRRGTTTVREEEKKRVIQFVFRLSSEKFSLE